MINYNNTAISKIFTIVVITFYSLFFSLSNNYTFASDDSPAIVGVYVYPKDNASNTQLKNIPITFGQVFKKGDIPFGKKLSVSKGDQSSILYQINPKSVYPDGSLKHAIVTALINDLSANGNRLEMFAIDGNESNSNSIDINKIISSGFNSSVEIDIKNGKKLHASTLDAYNKNGVKLRWLSGDLVNEWILMMPFVDTNNVEHPHLTARFSIRAYNNTDYILSDITIENNWTYEKDPQNFTYDVRFKDSTGNIMYSRDDLTHYHHARWRTKFWDKNNVPKIDFKHDTTYLIETKTVPNYDRSVKIKTNKIDSYYEKMLGSYGEPMGKGLSTTTAMGMAGGRPDIGLETGQAALYILTQNPKAKYNLLHGASRAGSWSIHFRDKKTDNIVLIDDYPYLGFLGTPGDKINKKTKKSEARAKCSTKELCKTPYVADTAHQPSFSFIPYLITGDYYHLEELKFWANFNLLNMNAHYRKFEKGLLKSNQVRGEAWAMRTLGQAAFILPDLDPQKAYFNEKLDNNINYFNEKLTDNPDAPTLGWTNIGYGGGLGYTNSKGENVGMAPWMDNFFTQSIGYLNDLGIKNSDKLLKWKSKFVTGLINDPNFCWLYSSTYKLFVKNPETKEYYNTFGEVYNVTMGNQENEEGVQLKTLSCGSKEMKKWREGIYKRKIKALQMVGYPTSHIGYGANMQPALAYAVDSGISGAKNAWRTYQTRDPKQDYSFYPEFSIVPRTIEQTEINNGYNVGINGVEVIDNNTDDNTDNSSDNSNQDSNTGSDNSNQGDDTDSDNSNQDDNTGSDNSNQDENASSNGSIEDVNDIKPGTWYEVPNSKMKDVIHPYGFKEVRGWSGPKAIIGARSGGAYDKLRKKLIIWGGGHQDYAGNEIYSFDINTLKWKNENIPSLDIKGGSERTGVYGDGKPRSRHTYNSLQYVPYLDMFCAFGAAGSFPSALISNGGIVDCYNMDIKKWLQKSKSPSYGRGVTAYDPVTGHIFQHGALGGKFLAEYIPEKDKWISHGTMWTNEYLPHGYTADIDPINRKMVAINGRGKVLSWDIGTNEKIIKTVVVNTVNLPEALTTGKIAPGLAYVPTLKKFVVWNGGESLYALDGKTWKWSRIVNSNLNQIIPTQANKNGTYGRFRYIPSKNALIVVNSIYENVYIYKLEGSGVEYDTVDNSNEDNNTGSDNSNQDDDTGSDNSNQDDNTGSDNSNQDDNTGSDNSNQDENASSNGSIKDINDIKPGTWYEVPNSKMKDVIHPYGFKEVRGWSGPKAIIGAWSGGAYDKLRKKLIIWGGGNNDYAGNEIYSFDINTLKWKNENIPSLDIKGGSERTGVYGDGKPRSRSTYNSLQYVSYLDMFCSFGAVGTYPSSQIRNGGIIDCYNMDTKKWIQKSKSPSYGRGITAYDPVTGHIFQHGAGGGKFLAEYIPETDKWVSHGTMWTGKYLPHGYTADIDPINRKMVAINNRGKVLSWDIGTNEKIIKTVVINTVNLPEALTTGKIAPGLAYVPTLKKFVVWNGGESLYALDGKTWEWSRIVNSNLNQTIPTQANKNGTYGRFRYIPSKNALIVVNSIYENVYIYKLEGSGVEYDTIITNTNANIYLNFDVVLTKIIMKHNKINDSIALYNKNSLFFGKLK